MRKNILSSVGLAVFGSLGAYCLMSYVLLLPFRYERSLYPYFIPFCILTGFISLILCLGIFFFNVTSFRSESTKISDTLLRKKFVRKSIIAEILIITLSFLPMLLLWEILRQ